MTNIFSFIAASILGLLCVAPCIDYTIPMMVNSFHWVYLVVASGLFAFYLLTQKLHLALKILLVYTLIVGCFFSQVPYFGFNAFLLLVVAYYAFFLFQKCNFKIILDMMVAVFWLEMCIASFRMMGMDTLMNLGKEEYPVFFGTIFQHMRFASLLCILAPFLLVKSKWYIIPISAAVALTASSGFALAVVAGVVTYLALDYFHRIPAGTERSLLKVIYLWTMLFVFAFAAFAIYINRASWEIAFKEGRIPVWIVCIKSWMFDTKGPMGPPDIFGISQTGPFDLKCFLFGHGLDTFYPLFPIFKHDPNPFPQAHCSYIQLAWELGLTGFTLFMAYLVGLFKKLYEKKEWILISGLVIIGVNALTAFPERMTQTMGLMVCFFAFCDLIAFERMTPCPSRLR